MAASVADFAETLSGNNGKMCQRRKERRRQEMLMARKNTVESACNAHTRTHVHKNLHASKALLTRLLPYPLFSRK